MDRGSEIERRRAAMQFATNSVRLSGLTVEESMRVHFERYVQDEITSEELIKIGMVHYDKTKNSQ